MHNNFRTVLDAVFPKEHARRAEGKCPFCNGTVEKEEFRDELSLKEFGISGLCQQCQDSFFQV